MDKRILFAVARGARAQVQLGPNRGWINSTQLTWHDDCVYRIHPDQLEYQYGPISTALRRTAEDPPRITDALWPVEKNYLNVYKYPDEMYMWADDLHKSLILLLVAEALADEGL